MSRRKEIDVPPDATTSVRNGSRFANTVLSEFTDFTDIDAETAFCNECRALFTLTKLGDTDTVLRREDTRLYIVKLLLHIGLLPKDRGFAVIARLIEVSALRPDLGLNEIIADFASTHGTTVSVVERIIDKNLNAYNDKFVDRVSEVTCTRPVTAKDILCDLALFVRIRFFDEVSACE